MDDRDQHVHRCVACDATWLCLRGDCYWITTCEACEAEEYALWATAQDLMVFQPVLQPEEALLGRTKDTK